MRPCNVNFGFRSIDIGSMFMAVCNPAKADVIAAAPRFPIMPDVIAALEKAWVLFDLPCWVAPTSSEERSHQPKLQQPPAREAMP